MLEVFGVRTMPSYQQVMSPTHDSFFQKPPPAPMMRRRRMANGDLEPEQLALPPVEPGDHPPAGQELAVVEEVEKEKDGKEEEGKKMLSTPARTTTGNLDSGPATLPTEPEASKSGGSKEGQMVGELEAPRGRPMALVPLSQPFEGQPLFSQEQLKASRNAARKAPQLFGALVPPTSSGTSGSEDPMRRPEFLKDEERRFGKGKDRRRGEGRSSEEEEGERVKMGSHRSKPPERFDLDEQDRLREEKEEEILWRWQISQEVRALSELCRSKQEENDQLRQELYEKRIHEEAAQRAKVEEEAKPTRPTSAYNTPDEGPTMPKQAHEGKDDRGRTPWSYRQPTYGGKGSRSRSKETRRSTSPTFKGALGGAGISAMGKSMSGGGKASTEVQQMEVMTLLVESMKALQRQISEGHEAQGTIKGVEVVRQLAELPTLGSLQGNTSQLQLGDWLLLVQPVVADLTATSDQWWEQTLREVEAWYQAHQAMAPLDRVRHEPVAPASLNVAKWAKLERRMATLLLKAIPEAQRDELVAMKRLSVFANLAHLHVAYCPGGVSEKQRLLRNLEEPAEPSGLHDTVVGLRKWLRWRARAQEIGATEPDPSILVKGLNRLTKKTLEGNEALRFRVSLARNALQVGTNPTALSVTQFATHLIAEVDQLAMMEKRNSSSKDPGSATNKVKKVEKEKGKELEGKVKNVGVINNESSLPPCKFFLTDNGCRKGKHSKWSHDQKDEHKRCYVCGAKNHLAPACPSREPSSSNPSNSPPKVKKEKEDEKGKNGIEEAEKTTAGGGQTTEDEKMDELLLEANKMLRMKKEKETSEAKMNKLHQQLDEIKRSIKTLKLTRVREAKCSAIEEESYGLLDPGATHPLRPLVASDSIEGLKKVSVALADGQNTAR